jgi:hypothetical protein
VRVRFLADADLNQAIVGGVLRREPTLDFRTARGAALRGLADSTVLELAAQQQRVLVSHDLGTMPSHFRILINAGKDSAGCIPDSAKSSCADGDRRTLIDLGRIGSSGMGEPPGVVAVVRLVLATLGPGVA